MDINVLSNDKCVVIEPRGSLDRDSTNEVEALIDSAITGGRKYIVFSFKNGDALLSEGVRLLVNAFDAARNAGGRLILVDVPKEVQATLRITNLDEFLGPIVSFEDALEVLMVNADTLTEGLTEPAAVETDEPETPAPSTTSADATPSPEKEAPATANAPAPPASSEDDEEEEEEKPHVLSAREKMKQLREQREKEGGVKKTPSMSEADIRKLVRRHMPGQIYVSIVDFYVSGKKSSASVDEVAAKVREKPKTVRKALRELDERGVLTPLGGDLYNYSPSAELREQLHEFFKRWRRPDQHSALLRIVLEAGK